MAKRGPRISVVSAAIRQVRCAIYTRKSTEEGLDQEFNSLDAQREACGAYIVSQRHEGWSLVPSLYDDGGYSGGTMERPALKRLLADIESDLVDVVVVYKVDRLTRALSDFAKIVEVLDARGASFVSVTQAFNTTTSMGRLTLNVLLSFAQFEREVTGERIRDKIAASKKKGMWMGGPVPLGYDVVERKLIVHEFEAATVRLIFERHQQAPSVRALVEELASLGICSKRRIMRDGRVVGGKPFSAGALTHLLRNVIYVGRIRHGDQVYPGEHCGLVDKALWTASQARLDCNAPRPPAGHRNLLAGRINDSSGRPMASEHAVKGYKRYRYYVCRKTAGSNQPAWRLPAGDCEALVRDALSAFLNDSQRISAELGIFGVGDQELQATCAAAAERIGCTAGATAVISSLDARVVVQDDRIEILFSRAALATLVSVRQTAPGDDEIKLETPVSLKRRGHEMRLVYAAPEARTERDPRLIQLIASGRSAYAELCKGGGRHDAIRRSHLSRLARLNFLAPDIVMSILDGRQPVELTARSLMRISQLPLCWGEQRRALGYG